MQQFGPYRVEALLGRGAMGSVYRAREVATGRAVALKVLQRVDDPRRRRRFEREARLAAAFDHPGIVKVHSAGTLQGIPYLACELIEGRELHTLYSEVSLERRVGWLRDAARALGHAHRRGIVHRDVKGANLLVDGEGRLRVVDFGVASARDVERLTRTGQWIGTPSHMAPEQFGGEALGPPCDVWALGVELYLAATGRLPFAAESPIELAGQVSKAACPRPRALSSEVSPELEAVILAALRPDAAERYPDGDALADDLDRLLAGERPRACGRRGRRVPLLAAGIFLSASLLGLLGAFGGAARSAEAARLAAVGQAAGAGAPARDGVAGPAGASAPGGGEAAPESGGGEAATERGDDAAATEPSLEAGIAAAVELATGRAPPEDLAQDASDFLARTVDLGPIAAYHTGKKLAKKGRFAEALPFLVAAAESGRYPRARTWVARDHLLPRDPEKAADWARRAAEAGHGEGLALYADCVRYGWGVPRGDPRECARRYERAIARDSKKLSGRVGNALGRLYAELGEFEDAREWLERSATHPRDSLPQSWVDLALLARERGDQALWRRSAARVTSAVAALRKGTGRRGGDAERARNLRLALAELHVLGLVPPGSEAEALDADEALRRWAPGAAKLPAWLGMRLVRALLRAGADALADDLLAALARRRQPPYDVELLAAARERGLWP